MITTKLRVCIRCRKFLLSLVYALKINALAHGDGTGHGSSLADLHSSVELGKAGTTAYLRCPGSQEVLKHIGEFCHKGFQDLCVMASNRLEDEPGDPEDVLILAGIVQKIAGQILDDDLLGSREAGADLLRDVFGSDHGRDEMRAQDRSSREIHTIGTPSFSGGMCDGAMELGGVCEAGMGVGCVWAWRRRLGTGRRGITGSTVPDAARYSMGSRGPAVLFVCAYS